MLDASRRAEGAAGEAEPSLVDTREAEQGTREPRLWGETGGLRDSDSSIEELSPDMAADSSIEELPHRTDLDSSNGPPAPGSGRLGKAGAALGREPEVRRVRPWQKTQARRLDSSIIEPPPNTDSDRSVEVLSD